MWELKHVAVLDVFLVFSLFPKKFDKTIGNILLIYLKICFDKALQLAATVTVTAWKVPQCRVISGPHFPLFSPSTGKYGPEIASYLDTFQAVYFHDNG